MIIHIDGPSGSGKTTLGNKLTKNKHLMVVDTDDIDDKNALKLLRLKKYDHFFTDKNMEKDLFFKQLSKMNKEDEIKLKEKAKKQNKLLVMSGLVITPKKPDYKFFIKIDLDTNYKRVTARTIDDMCKYHQEIKTLLKKNITIHKIYLLLLYKYKLRMGIPSVPPEMNKWNNKRLTDAKKNKYKIMKSDDIYNEIINKVLPIFLES